MPKKSKKRGNRSITTHRKKYKVSSKSVTTTNVQPLPSQPSPVQQVTVDNGDSSIDSALRLRSTIKPPACNDADKEMFDIIINDAVVRHTCIDINNSNKDSIKSTLSSYGSLASGTSIVFENKEWIDDTCHLHNVNACVNRTELKLNNKVLLNLNLTPWNIS